ncbi:MAG: DUF547 domain-containing protein [Candidatus Competibacterales bacterium]
MTLLNPRFWESDRYHPEQLPDALAAELTSIRAVYYNDEANTFDYAAFASSAALNRYTAVARALADARPGDLNRSQRLAFWLNVFNGLAIHGITTLKPGPGAIPKGLFTDSQYVIGNRPLSLDDVEHGLLRHNGKKFRALTAPWSRDDPRLAWSVEPRDPRVHFALYSACRSSPLWRVFRAATVDAQLDEATREAIGRGFVMTDDGLTLTLTVPKMFQWYARDFGPDNRALVEFIAGYRDPREAERLRINAERVSFAYRDFDWRLNGPTSARDQTVGPGYPAR